MNLAARLDRLVLDPLANARGVRAIGYVGADIPVEPILAAGAMPIRLHGEAQAATPLADRYLEGSFSAASRSIAEHWLSGRLDALHAVVFSRSDDSAQRLYYYLCELQRLGRCRGPTPLLYDIARTQRTTSLAHTVDSTRQLAIALSTDFAALPAAACRVATRFALLSRLTTLRAEAAPPAGSLMHSIRRAADADWSAAFDAALTDWLAAPPAFSGKRIVLIGSTPLDERIHCAVEAAGHSIVAELNESSLIYESFAPEAADILQAAAERCHGLSCNARSLLQSSSDLCDRMHTLAADGAIVWLTAADTGLGWEAPHLERALRAAGLPVLTLTQQPYACAPATLHTIERFARSLVRTQ